MKKKYENKQNIFHTMKVNFNLAIQVKDELKVKFNDQQVNLKHLKEQCDIDDEDEVQKTTVARTPRKRVCLCVTCYLNICHDNLVEEKKCY